MPSETASVLSYLNTLVNFYYEPGDRAARVIVCKGIKDVLHRVQREHIKTVAHSIVPLMFMARNDYDDGGENATNIGEMYQDLWLENSDIFDLKAHLELIIDESLKNLKRTSWLHKRQGADSITAIVPITAENMLPYANDIIGVLVEMLPGRVWNGKESIPISLSQVWQLAVDNYSDSSIEKEERWRDADSLVGGIFIRELNRNGLPLKYHHSLYEAVGQICEKERNVRPNVELGVIDELLKNVDSVVKFNSEKQKADFSGDNKENEVLVASAIVSIGRAWPRRSNSNMQFKYYKPVLELLRVSMKGTSWNVHLAAMTALRDVLTNSLIPDVLNEENVKNGIDLAFLSIQQNKNPRVIVAALKAILAVLEKANGDSPDAELNKTAVAVLKMSAPQCKNMVQRLLSNDEPTVVHIASLVEKQANKILKSKVFISL
mmetsp:Transcript_28443/g.34726  ORF Transcript_28443/g.34726 Transcript_28443/m.34726 type:complete len:434 (+) Transcript_28443:3-1304(+)